MTDCARIAALLDVYVDDESTVETNVMVQQHVEHCEACARRLHDLRELRASMREALGRDAAPEGLYRRVRTVVAAPPSPSVASFIRNWIVPATATALVASLVLPWPTAEPDTYPLMAVGEHVACALDGVVPPRDVSHYAADASMPLIPGAGGKVRILESHACGQQADYLLHMILEEGGTKASIFITRAGEGAERVFRARRSGDYEVSQVRTTRHRAFVVIDRTHARALREWRAPTVQRLQRFLKEVEGT